MKLTQNQLCRLFYIVLGVAAIVLAMSMALSSLTDAGDSIGFVAIVCLLLWVGCCALLLHAPLFQNPNHTIAAMVLLLLGICLRVSLFDHVSGDYVSFLSVWTETMRGMTIREALSTPIGDYNMPYLYIILLISRLPFYDLYCIKLFSVAADLFLALGVGKLIMMLTGKERMTLLGFSAALFCPTFWLNSGYWGQCDSIYGVFAIWALYFALIRHPKKSMALFGLALSFKLQTIFILPILAFLLVKEYVKLRDLPVFFLTFFAASLPALLGGRSFSDTFSIYFSQMEQYPYLSLNAPSFWSLIHNDYFYELGSAPVLLAVICVLLMVYLFLRKYHRMDSDTMVELSLIFSLAIPWLLPKMHERYFFLAETLSIVYAAIYPRKSPVAVILLLGGFLIYCPYLFGEMPILSLRMVAVIYGLLTLYLLSRLYRRLYEKDIFTQGGSI